MKQVMWEEDIGGLDLCAEAVLHATSDHSPARDWIRSICEDIERSADRDDGSELFERYLVVLSEPDQEL